MSHRHSPVSVPLFLSAREKSRKVGDGRRETGDGVGSDDTEVDAEDGNSPRLEVQDSRST